MEPKRRTNKNNQKAESVLERTTTHLEINPIKGGSPAKESIITMTAKAAAALESIRLLNLLTLDVSKTHNVENKVNEITM